MEEEEHRERENDQRNQGELAEGKPKDQGESKVGSNQQLQMWVCGEDAQYDK